MARDQHVMQLSQDAYLEITDGSAAEVTLIVVSGHCELRGTVDAIAPAPDARGLPAGPSMGCVRTAPSQFFAASGVGRIWGKARGGPCEVYIDHAEAGA